jgi:catechol 2,3-dioxygenase-like lactoylglutathione lyase family enzyme
MLKVFLLSSSECRAIALALPLRPRGIRLVDRITQAATGLAVGLHELEAMMIESISAITLPTHDMARAVTFYTSLGFALNYGGADAGFTSFLAGAGFLNLTTAPAERQWSWWGRAIFHVDDVDALHARAVAAGLSPTSAPRDASWGERYFHIIDPDGHELSFARPLQRPLQGHVP